MTTEHPPELPPAVGKSTAGPCLLIAGFPRSGSSLTMRMLHAGGIPLAGNADPMSGEQPDPSRLMVTADHATKVLDQPLRMPSHYLSIVQHHPVQTILLTRDHQDQARSQWEALGPLARLIMGKAGDRDNPEEYITRLSKSLGRDLHQLRRQLRSYGPVIETRFEDLTADPAAEAERWANWIGRPLDIPAMVAAAHAPYTDVQDDAAQEEE